MAIKLIPLNTYVFMYTCIVIFVQMFLFIDRFTSKYQVCFLWINVIKGREINIWNNVFLVIYHNTHSKIFQYALKSICALKSDKYYSSIF